MTQSLQKSIESIVESGKGDGWQCSAILELLKTEMITLQSILQEREFDTGNWMEEMDQFMDAYIDNL